MAYPKVIVFDYYKIKNVLPNACMSPQITFSCRQQKRLRRSLLRGRPHPQPSQPFSGKNGNIKMKFPDFFAKT